MTQAFARAVLLAATLAVAAPAAAQDAESETGQAAGEEAAPDAACPTGPVPQIRVVTDITDTVYDYSRPLAELNRLGARAATATGNDVRRLLGLTHQTFAIAANTAPGKVVERADGGFCYGYGDGTITLRLTTEIFLASELPAGSCLYGQVLAHEERHAKVGRRLFSEYAAAVDTAIADSLAEVPFIAIDEPGVAPLAAAARLQAIIEPLYNDFKSTYRKRQAIIDTSGEFARVREACPGEQEKLGQ
jgi:hypothetical protein